MPTPALSAELQVRIDRLLPLLRRWCVGAYGLALGGAHAKGVEDADSDLDLYLFALQVLPAAGREALCREMLPEVAGLTSWGADEPFDQGGTDFVLEGTRVECWLRHTDRIEGILDECEAGVVRQELVTWTVMGFYNHCTLSDLYRLVPLDDPDGLLAGWQARVRRYPPRLKAAIIRRHLDAARFWPHNAHYDSAVARGDAIYALGIVQQVAHNLIQVLFALNESYFPGDKKLALALEHLPRQPEGTARRITALLWPGAPPTPATLVAQQRELQRLLREVEALVAAEG